MTGDVSVTRVICHHHCIHVAGYYRPAAPHTADAVHPVTVDGHGGIVLAADRLGRIHVDCGCAVDTVEGTETMSCQTHASTFHENHVTGLTADG